MDKKKLIQIIGFIFIVVILTWVMWLFFWREAPVEPGITIEPPGTVGGLPGIDVGAPTGVVIDPVTGLPVSSITTEPIDIGTTQPTTPGYQIDDKALGGLTSVDSLTSARIKNLQLVPGDDMNFYNEQDNKFYRLTKAGDIEAISDKQFYNVDMVSWSPDGNSAILEYPDSSNIYYDFATDKQVTLPQQMTEFKFDQAGDKVGFKWMSELANDDWLGVANPDGSEIKFVEPMNSATEDVQVGWSPSGQVVALYREGTGLNSMDIYFIGQYGENFKSLTVQGRGFEGKWLPDGKHLLYQVYSDNTGSRPSLWLTRADGDNIGLNNNPLGLNTWIDKCTITGTSAYCAVPESLPEGAAYVPEVADNIPDLFYKIDLTTGAKTLLARPVGDRQSYTAQQLVVSDDESVLYFIDKQTGRLYSLNLK